MAYSKDLRERVVRAHEAGAGSFVELAERFDVGLATVNRWVRLKRETGALNPRPRGGGFPAKVQGGDLDAFRKVVEGARDATRAELAQKLVKATRIQVSVATIGRTLKRLGFTRKKRHFTRRKETPSAL